MEKRLAPIKAIAVAFLVAAAVVIAYCVRIAVSFSIIAIEMTYVIFTVSVVAETAAVV